MAQNVIFYQSTKDCRATEFLEAPDASFLSFFESLYGLTGAAGTYGIRKDASGNHYIICKNLDEATILSSQSSSSGGMFKFASTGAFSCWGSLLENEN